MPTVLQIGPYRFFFYSHEPNEPPHIHVASGRATAKVWTGTFSLARSKGFPAHELSAILRLVRSNRALFLKAWHDYFGASPNV